MQGAMTPTTVRGLRSLLASLQHVDGWQWRPDMIWFDNLNCVKTPNYYVQQMYASNPGTHTIAIEGDSLDLKGEKGIYASAVVDQEKSEIIVKIVNVNTHKMDFNLSLNGLKRKQILADKANVSVLQTYNMNSQNTLDNPLNIVPQNEQWEVKDATIKHSLEGCAFYVLKVKMN
jgi:alpha-N-arabinofuranosidase